jgi:hypothetical protein
MVHENDPNVPNAERSERMTATYHYGVPSRTLTLDELVELLERFRQEPAGSKTAPEIAESQLQLLLARIKALTDALRDAESNEAARLAARIVVSDLDAVADQFRGRANTMRAALARALADLREARGEAPRAKGC